MKIKCFITVFITAILCGLCLISKTNYSYAEQEKYLRVLSENVYLYENADFTEKIFIIPYSYYVKVEGEFGEAVKVSYGEQNGEYPTVKGYVKKDEVKEVDYIPTLPFAVTKVSTNFQDVLFGDNTLLRAYFNVPKNSVLYLYGDISVKEKPYVYVYAENKLGYLDKESLNSYFIKLNPDKIESEETYEEPTETENQKQKFTTSKLSYETLQVVIIVGISVVCISVVYALFKPTKHKNEFKNEEFFEETE